MIERNKDVAPIYTNSNTHLHLSLVYHTLRPLSILILPKENPASKHLTRVQLKLTLFLA